MPTRPLWAEVSSHRLLANYKKLRRMAGSQAELMPVVKANAYGHDVLACAPLLAAAGAQWLGVTSTEEGAAVRAVCPEPRILLMSGIFRGEADTVIDLGLTPVVWEPWQLDLLEEAAVRAGHACRVGCGSPGDRYRDVAPGGAGGGRSCAVASFSGGVLPAAGRGDDPLQCAGDHVFGSPQSPVGWPGDRAQVDG